MRASENQNCLNKGRWFYSHGLGTLLWGCSDDLVPSLPTWGNKLLLWEDPVYPALTKPHGVVLACAQKTGKWCVIISSFLLWDLQEEWGFLAERVLKNKYTWTLLLSLLVALLRSHLFIPQMPWKLLSCNRNPGEKQLAAQTPLGQPITFPENTTSIRAAPPALSDTNDNRLCTQDSH